MIARCCDPKHWAFKDYGGRGIYVCDRWRHDLDAFLVDMGPRPTQHHQLERRDNNGPYDPDNCKWATPTEQGRNKRNNRKFRYDGKMRPLSEIVEMTGIPYATLWARLTRYDMTISEATKDSKRLSKRTAAKYLYNGEYLSLFGIAKRSGTSVKLLTPRVQTLGWSIEDAIRKPKAKPTVTFHGREMTIRELAEATNTEYRRLYKRIFELGWTAERAVSESVHPN